VAGEAKVSVVDIVIIYFYHDEQLFSERACNLRARATLDDPDGGFRWSFRSRDSRFDASTRRRIVITAIEF
jgi:hypothetical protein